MVLQKSLGNTIDSHMSNGGGEGRGLGGWGRIVTEITRKVAALFGHVMGTLGQKQVRQCLSE